MRSSVEPIGLTGLATSLLVLQLKARTRPCNERALVLRYAGRARVQPPAILASFITHIGFDPDGRILLPNRPQRFVQIELEAVGIAVV